MELIQMNKEPIQCYALGENYQMYFFRSTYYDGSPYICCEEPEEGPFADITTSLSGYGFEQTQNTIFFNHDLMGEDFETLREVFVENFCTEETVDDCEIIEFGPFNTKTLVMHLKDEYL